MCAQRKTRCRPAPSSTRTYARPSSVVGCLTRGTFRGGEDVVVRQVIKVRTTSAVMG
ncbi:MAG TPA: hypothetical protein VND64_06920 [Pirellulales bacterium]|nr:hypothetical protein [Pirellulales bacterium]